MNNQSSGTTGDVRVRIAPSPTGYLHVGTARTAACNYLFARHNGGKFLVRIEDTDAERSRPELIKPILDALTWLGITSDEELVFQSKRGGLYAEYLERFMATGHAYYCFCTPDEIKAERECAREEKRRQRCVRSCPNLSPDDVKTFLDAGAKPAVRIRIPPGETSFDDIVGGRLSKQNEDIEDLIIARSNGTVTYNFAVVVDDYEMGITHVIRGNDHITNTFKQIILYDAFGFEKPVFGHVPLILRPDKRKVSKRLGDKDVGEYRAEGILPEAMVNYLSLLGWSPKTDREIYTIPELIDIFNKANFNKSNAVFDEEKLLAFNKAHISMMSNHDLATLVAPLLVEAGLTTKYWLETRWEYLRTVMHLVKERARRITDFVDRGGYFFSFDYTYDEKAEQKHFKPEAADLLAELADRFDKLEPFTHETTEATLSELAGERDVKKGAIIHPTRLAVSGVPVGPGLYDLLAALGQPIVVERMKKAAEYIRRKG